MRKYVCVKAGVKSGRSRPCPVRRISFIANHLIKIGGGKTYAQVSAEALASPGNAKLAATASTHRAVSGVRTGRIAWSAQSGW